jgi:hypothetical protein
MAKVVITYDNGLSTILDIKDHDKKETIKAFNDKILQSSSWVHVDCVLVNLEKVASICSYNDDEEIPGLDDEFSLLARSLIK